MWGLLALKLRVYFLGKCPETTELSRSEMGK